MSNSYFGSIYKPLTFCTSVNGELFCPKVECPKKEYPFIKTPWEENNNNVPPLSKCYDHVYIRPYCKNIMTDSLLPLLLSLLPLPPLHRLLLLLRHLLSVLPLLLLTQTTLYGHSLLVRFFGIDILNAVLIIVLVIYSLQRYLQYLQRLWQRQAYDLDGR